MDLESLFALMFSDDLTLEKFVQFIKSINYTEFDDERLKNIKESLKTVLGDLVPKLNIKKYNIFIIVSCLIFSGISSMAWLKIAYALLALSASYRDVIKPVMEYFKDKKRYESGEDVQYLRDVINDIDALLKFRKNRAKAVDLEEKHNNSINKDLEYLSKLIKLINSKVDLLSASDKIRFDRVLSNLNEIKSDEEIKEAIDELESVVDVIVEDLGVEVKEELNVDRGRY